MSFAARTRKNLAGPVAKPMSDPKVVRSNLRIGEPHDAFELEADRIADVVMSADSSRRPNWTISNLASGDSLQRKCSCAGSGGPEGECEECKEKKTLHRKATSASSAGHASGIVHDVLRSPGRPLDHAARRFFEPRFRRDFSHVRIHVDGRAAESAQSVGALAYAVGNDVVFGAGQYAPGNKEGQKLLAHELAHTLQQSGGRPFFASHLSIDGEEDHRERQADDAAEHALRWRSQSVTAAPSLVLRRAKIGWTGANAGSLNTGPKSVGSIRRIPIEGLTQGHQPTGRAIVLIPSAAGANPFDPVKDVEVLLHFHGHDAQYAADAKGKYKDVDIFQIEKQLEASNNPQLIGLLPQGDSKSSFGVAAPGVTPSACDKKNKKAFDSDAFISEVLSVLTTNGAWTSGSTPSPTAAPKVTNVMISGHSGAGELINENLLGGAPGSSLPSKMGTLKEVALFDAINGPCEFLAVSQWLETTLQSELANLKGKSEPDQLKFLKTSARFRSYFESSAAIGDFYSRWHIGPLPRITQLASKKPLQTFLADWFKTNTVGLPAKVAAEWVSHYVVTDMKRVAHDVNPVNIMTAPTPSGSTPLTESISVLPKQEDGPVASPAKGADELVHLALQQQGCSLQGEELKWASKHFGRDLSAVKIHTDHYGEESARALRARAFTVGPNIVFASGQFAAHSLEGRRLLGHELAHVFQQETFSSLPKGPVPLRVGSPSDPLERKADYHAVHPGPVEVVPGASGRIVRRVPAEGDLEKSVCETTANPPKEQPGECNYARPENCPTYETWIQNFFRLKTFQARATPEPVVLGANTFPVLGDQPATRLADKPDAKSMAKDAKSAPRPTTELKPGETFIDHPTDSWVKRCLPDNLRATAYQLPADCADIAIILRHVWLAAHHRTQVLTWGKESWTIGDETGGEGRTRALKAIGAIGSESVQSLVSPYSDAQGNRLLSITQLAPLLHPGDILVWEHREHGLDKGRTGGHTLTITEVNRDADGKLKRLSFLQGNEPIFGEPHKPDDDKGKIIEKLKVKPKDEKKVRAELGHSPGRRIEAASTGDLPGIPNNRLTFEDVDLPAAKKGEPPKKVWAWDKTTILLAAGPPRAVARPNAAPAAKGKPAERRLTDWVPSFAHADSDATWQAVLEAMLLEARAFIEGGRDILEDEARKVGDAAGKKIWEMAKKDPRGLANESHFARLRAAELVIEAVVSGHQPSPTSPDLSSPQDQLTEKFLKTLRIIKEALQLAARGASDISFGKAGKSVVKTLLTGFDPFESSGSLAVPSKGTWNPSGAAVLALDNQNIPTKSSKGKDGVARVQGVILPVDFEQFQAGGKGLIEQIVTEKAPDLDAAITVSMAGTGIGPFEPVRLERYVVGTHAGPGKPPEQIPAAGGAGEAIIESNAPLQQIAGDAENKPKGKSVGNFLLKFDSEEHAKAAAAALNGKIPEPKKKPAEVEASNENIPPKIHESMAWAANASDVHFSDGKSIFHATVLRAPAGTPKPVLGEDITLGFADNKSAQAAKLILKGTVEGNTVKVSDATVIQEILKNMVRDPAGVGISFSVDKHALKAKVLSGPGGDFLSNEVSYRTLRLLNEKKLPQKPLSFHVHTPAANEIPADAGTPESKGLRAKASSAAKGLLGRLVATLKRLIAATAKVILDRREGTKP